MNKPVRQSGSKKVAPAQKPDRKRAIERVRRRLVRDGSPRLLVSFLLALTGAAGFLISTVLLHLGVTIPAVRYPLAVISAYCVFLLLLRLWLALRQRRAESESSVLSDIGGDALSHGLDFDVRAGETAAQGIFGGGADFGGAGAGGVWSGDASGMAADVSGDISASMSAGGGGGASGSMDWIPDIDVDLDPGEGCFWIIIPIVAIVGVIAAMFYVVYVAPIFLAEILVDALLLAGLYKRLQGVEPRHWLRSAIRRTLLPVLIATALFIAAGYLMGRIAPDARSIGEFWQQINSTRVER